MTYHDDCYERRHYHAADADYVELHTMLLDAATLRCAMPLPPYKDDATPRYACSYEPV